MHNPDFLQFDKGKLKFSKEPSGRIIVYTGDFWEEISPEVDAIFTVIA